MAFDFCKNYSYKNGLGKTMKNSLHIYYNLQLVINDFRLSFLIQPIDYYYYSDFENFINTFITITKDLDIYFKSIGQGLLFYKLENHNIISSHKELSNKHNHKILGKILSYPCWDAEPTEPRFISFMLFDKFGQYQLFTNWFNYDWEIDYFKFQTKTWKKYLEKNFNATCEYYID